MLRPLLVLCISPLLATAQPVLEYANLVPIGTTTAIHMVTAPGASDPGPDGANVTWDFSSATLQLNAGTVSWVDPATTPQGSSYPTSNLAQVVAAPIGTIYNYFDLQPAHLDQLANGVGGSDASVYADPKTIIQFPLHYQDSYTDNFTDNGAPASYIRSYTGYGTVILPTGTYTNVVKMTSTGGAIDFLLSDPISQLVHIEDDGSALVFGDPVSGVAEQAGPVLRAFPNPATDALTVSGVRAAGTWVLVDAEGRAQREGAARPGTLAISLEGLAPGCYALRLREGEGVRSLRVVKQ